MICQRSSNCPSDKHCLGKQKPKLKPKIDEIWDSVING